MAKCGADELACKPDTEPRAGSCRHVLIHQFQLVGLLPDAGELSIKGKVPWLATFGEPPAVGRDRAAGLSLGCLALADRWVFVLLGFVLLTVICGVVLPAVWSSKPARRRDTRTVLETLWTARPTGNKRPWRISCLAGAGGVAGQSRDRSERRVLHWRGRWSVLLGTIWGPHVLHGGEQLARSPLAHTAAALFLTSRDAYSYVLGVKGSQVQILSSRPDCSRSVGVSEVTPEPLSGFREPNGEPADVHTTRGGLPQAWSVWF
jgi:hypothetical protein